MSKGRILGLIPAKGGSVRLARKNLRALGGRTLLQRAIESACEAACLDRVVVSTEDSEIAEAARAAGADVPFMRPAHLARDPHGVVDVCLHALDALESNGEIFSEIAILLPTSPFRCARHVREAIERYRATGAAFLMSVTRLDSSILAAHVVRDELMEPLHPEWIGRLGARAGGEHLPTLVKANGAVVVANANRLRAERNYYVYPLVHYVMPWPAGLDIDTEDDLQYAQFLLDSGRVAKAAA